jgi:hypothetical protein
VRSRIEHAVSEQQRPFIRHVPDQVSGRSLPPGGMPDCHCPGQSGGPPDHRPQVRRIHTGGTRTCRAYKLNGDQLRFYIAPAPGLRPPLYALPGFWAVPIIAHYPAHCAHCCPLLPIVAHYCPLLPIIAHYCPLWGITLSFP